MVQSGQVTYSAWWETLPQANRPVPLSIHAGDKMSASITQQSDGTWQIVIDDATNRQSWQKNVMYRSSVSSADWIEEAPVTGRMAQLPLDAFGAITFTDTTTVENGQARTNVQAGGHALTMGMGKKHSCRGAAQNARRDKEMHSHPSSNPIPESDLNAEG